MSDFEKARDEAFPVEEDARDSVKLFALARQEGANWAYEWCNSQRKVPAVIVGEAYKEIERLTKKLTIAKGALEYVARHYNTPKQMTLNILDECVTVCTQALAEIEGEK